MGRVGEADLISRITPPVRGRCRIFVNNKPGFPCPAVAVETLSLRVGTEITPEMRRRIEQIERQCKCRAAALRFLATREHGRSELAAKLHRRFEPDIVKVVIDDLLQSDILNDARFAKAKAESSARRGRHGPARALADLQRSGVSDDVANEAIRDTFGPDDRLAVALDAARRLLPRMKNLPAQIARQRLAGLLGRRGFDLDDIITVVEKTLGPIDDSGRDGDRD